MLCRGTEQASRPLQHTPPHSAAFSPFLITAPWCFPVQAQSLAQPFAEPACLSMTRTPAKCLRRRLAATACGMGIRLSGLATCFVAPCVVVKCWAFGIL